MVVYDNSKNHYFNPISLIGVRQSDNSNGNFEA